MTRIALFLIAVLVVFGVPYYYSAKAQKLAQSYSNGPFCWVLPGADGPQVTGQVKAMHLSLTPPGTFGFWGDTVKRLGRGIDTPPHFAIAIPEASSINNSRLLGWSYGTGDYYDLSEKASVLGLFWFPDDCAKLLAAPEAS